MVILTERSRNLLPGTVFNQVRSDSYLSFLLVEVVDDDADEEVEGEEGAEYDENDKVEIHVEVDLLDRLLLHLHTSFTTNTKVLTFILIFIFILRT